MSRNHSCHFGHSDHRQQSFCDHDRSPPSFSGGTPILEGFQGQLQPKSLTALFARTPHRQSHHPTILLTRCQRSLSPVRPVVHSASPGSERLGLKARDPKLERCMPRPRQAISYAPATACVSGTHTHVSREHSAVCLGYLCPFVFRERRRV
jgi:hypothetical protein